MTEDAGEDSPDPTDVRFVGPVTAECIADADFGVSAILEKEVSYRQLVDAGVNPGVATKLRREHSLSWSFGGSGAEDLDRRSSHVRGLRDEERAWVAASTGDWETESPGVTGSPETGAEAEADGSGEAEAAEEAWRERASPDPVTEIAGVTQDDAAELAKAGINSVRSLATANPEAVADVLGLDVEQVAEWRDAAAELT